MANFNAKSTDEQTDFIPEVSSFANIQEILKQCLDDPNCDALRGIPLIKKWLHRGRKLFTTNEQAWAWFMISRVYEKSSRYHEAYDTIVLSEEVLDPTDAHLSLEIYLFSLHLASLNNDTVHVLLVLPKVLSVLKAVVPKQFITHAEYTQFFLPPSILE